MVARGAAKMHRCHSPTLDPDIDPGSRACINEWTLVTAASPMHWCPLLVWGHAVAAHWAGWDVDPARSVSPAPPAVRPPRVVIYSLNLAPRQLAALRGRLAPAWWALAPYMDIVVREFEFDGRPEHMRPEQPTDERGEWGGHYAGDFAWKPVILGELANEARAMVRTGPHPVHEYPHRGVVVWLDAGVFPQPFRARFGDLLARAKADAFVAGGSDGTGADWTHPGMYAALGLSRKQRAIVNASANIDASRLAFDFDNEDVNVLATVVAPWRECAMRVDCISPPGSGRWNHRQDQSALGAVVALHPAVTGGTLGDIGNGLEPQQRGGLFCHDAPGL